MHEESQSGRVARRPPPPGPQEGAREKGGGDGEKARGGAPSNQRNPDVVACAKGKGGRRCEPPSFRRPTRPPPRKGGECVRATVKEVEGLSSPPLTVYIYTLDSR